MLHNHPLRRSAFFLFMLPALLWAQKEFPVTWESKFSVDARWRGYTEDLAFVIGGDMSEIEVIDGATGKSLWVYNMKEKQGLKKCEDWKTHHESSTVEVITQKSSSAPLVSTYLDYRTGEVVAETQLASRTKEPARSRSKTIRTRRVNQSSCEDVASNTTIDIGYDAKNIISAKGGTDLNITVEASGGNSWTANFTGKVVRHLNNDMLPAEEGDVILDVSSGYGRVFVVYEGITCLDLATGKVLWNTTFDNVEYSGGLKAKQEIGRSAPPLITSDGVYICDFTKGERAIKKLDLSTGAVLWQADKLSKDDIVSELLVDGGNLIAHFGGLIRVEQYIPGVDGKPDVYKVDYVFEGSTSLRAYAATTGKVVWNTEAMDLSDNFKKSECSMVTGNGQVMACGEKNLYTFDATSGKLTKQVDYNAKTVGKAKWLYGYNGTLMIEGEDGITALKPDGTVIYAVNTGKCLMTETRGDAFIVWTGKKADDRSAFIRFDPATGAIAGKQEDTPRPCFDTTGDRFLKFDGQKLSQYRTN